MYVGYKDELFAEDLNLDNINWSYPNENKEFEALVKIRYNMKPVAAHVSVAGKNCYIKFNHPVSAISKGQACVFYNIEDGHLLGGGFI